MNFSLTSFKLVFAVVYPFQIRPHDLQACSLMSYPLHYEDRQMNDILLETVHMKSLMLMTI